ncbi:glycoside hydrolase family protein [Photobacterium kasasachensis]|uniref:glycoside hydrolase family protein n=1 Tax=Photobacterium kasasachensis TaxID=2910240 RepID=UPI003D10ADB4
MNVDTHPETMLDYLVGKLRLMAGFFRFSLININWRFWLLVGGAFLYGWKHAGKAIFGVVLPLFPAVVIVGLLSVLPSGTLKTSDAGLKLIMDYEGCQLNAYKCSANVWTNGYGHTVGVTPNSEVTHEEVFIVGAGNF